MKATDLKSLRLLLGQISSGLDMYKKNIINLGCLIHTKKAKKTLGAQRDLIYQNLRSLELVKKDFVFLMPSYVEFSFFDKVSTLMNLLKSGNKNQINPSLGRAVDEFLTALEISEKVVKITKGSEVSPA
jgi:hypothetical protein